ncbi:MAG: hypothetical protein M5U22_02490 [Thermoleophilia bacterium]|nr:hypothetical protein [Thermoleophilia bacterium]
MTERGEPCRATALRDEPFCFFHSPTHQEEAAAARKLGGQRRRKEQTVAGAFDFAGLSTVADIRRLVEIAAFDVLSLESSLSRARTLAYLAQTAVKLLQAGEMEERLLALEEAVSSRELSPTPIFDLELEAEDVEEDES